MKIITQVFCLGLLVALGLQACTEQDSKENGGDQISQKVSIRTNPTELKEFGNQDHPVRNGKL
ncbi:MAG: hypothetical protein R2767_04545 [Chitinophagales bacterium]